MSLFDMTGRVCLVTGSTMGMGRATAERMAEHGAKVVVTSRREADAAKVAAEINGRYGEGRAIGAQFDVKNRGDIQPLVDRVLDQWGRIDTLMCSAAHINFGRLEAISPEDIDESLTTNIGNYAALTKAVVPSMRKQGGGNVIYVLSTLGFFGAPSFLAYGMTKAALGQMTRVLAVDYGPDNIRVNSIVPGNIKNAARHYEDPERAKTLVGRIPLGRFGEPDEIAGCAVFLSSPAGGYATGQCFFIDGGQILKGNEGAEEAIALIAAARAKMDADRTAQSKS